MEEKGDMGEEQGTSWTGTPRYTADLSECREQRVQHCFIDDGVDVGEVDAGGACSHELVLLCSQTIAIGHGGHDVDGESQQQLPLLRMSLKTK